VAYAAPVRRPAVLADLLPRTLARDVALVVGGAGFIGLLAQVSFPVAGSPVPVTGQTFAVLLVGASLGFRRSLAATALYLLAGLAGVPWYAGHAHGAIAASFGYLVSYVVVAPVVGALAARGGDRTPLRTVATMALGTALVYAIGVPWLAIDLHLGAGTAVHEGMTIFLLGDALKVLLAAAVLPAAWKLVRR
jgi:biotin transport system substrate-specific component